MYSNLSIKKKILASVLGINAFVFLVLFLIYYNFSHSVVEKETTEKAFSKMSESISTLESFLKEKAKIGWTISLMPTVKQWLATNRVRYVDKQKDPKFFEFSKMFMDLANKDKQINSVFIASELTNMYYGPDPYPVDTTYKVTERPWYVAAKAKGVSSFDVSEDFSTKQVLVNNRVPIYDDFGIILGMSGSDIKLKGFMEFISSLKLFETGKIYILNKEGAFVFHPDSTKILVAKLSEFKDEEGKYDGFETASVKISEGGEGVLEVSEENVDRFLFYKPIKSLDWTFVLSVSKEEINAPLSSLSYISLLIFIASFTVLSIAIMFVANTISKPMQTLTEDILKAAKSGDLNYYFTSYSKDEIGRLSESFNFLMKSLNTKVNVVKEIAHGNLDVDIEVISQMDELGKSMTIMRNTIKNVVNEIDDLSLSALQGKLSIRANASNYDGDYKKILLGINETIDSILGPINEAIETLEKLADKNLAIRMEGNYNGDHAKLKETLNLAIEHLDETLKQVSITVESHTKAALQITGLTEDISDGIEKQKDQTNEVATAIEEMTGTIHETSRNANVMAETATKAKNSAEDGGIVVEKTILGMKRIADKVNKSAEVVHELGKSSNEIGEIISVINDIADQTNLLALNAAIEAARAGEQGRGFAIVADEVRKLAERTTKATKEIDTMIKKIQRDTKDAVASMQAGKEETISGIELADKAGEALKQIVSISQEVTEKVLQITQASSQQSQVSEQISRSIDLIASHSQETSNGMSMIGEHVGEFKNLTDHLRKLNNQFLLSESSNILID